MRTVVLLASALPRETVRLVSAVVVTVLLVPPGWANSEGTEAGAALAAVSAVWTSQELRFKLDDSRAQYTCEKFRDKVRKLLLALGARKDLQVEARPCMNEPIGFGGPMGIKDGPSFAPQVSIRMQVLKVPGEPRPAPDGIPAHWKSIDLMDEYGPLNSGDCALAKRIVESLLPLFTTRNVDYYRSPRCDRPGNPTGARLRLEVLVADQR
jgi:hypothetical protein